MSGTTPPHLPPDRRGSAGVPASPATIPGARWFAAHELRTPLQAVKGGVELLLEARGAGLGPELLEIVGLIATAATELEGQLDLLAELAALHTARHPAPVAIDLQALLARPAVATALAAPAMPAGPALDTRVLVAPEPFDRALTLLTAAAGGALPCALRLGDSGTIGLELAIPAGGDGAGSIRRALALELFQHAAVTTTTVTGTGLDLDLDLDPAPALRRCPTGFPACGC